MLRRFMALGVPGAICLASSLAAQTPRELFELASGRDTAAFEAAAAAALRATPHDGLLQQAVMRVREGQLRWGDAAAAARRALQGDSLETDVRAQLLLRLGADAYIVGDSGEAHRSLAAAAAGADREGQRQATYLLRTLGLDSSYTGWRVLELGDLRLHLPPGGPAEDEIRPWAAASGKSLAAIQAFFRTPLPRRIDVYVWRDDASAAAAGLAPLAFASMAFAVVHTAPGHTPGHELAHVVSWYAGRGPGPRRRAPLIFEGTGVAFDGTVRDRVQSARDGMRQAGVTSVSIDSLWSKGGPEALIYPVGGLLVQRLIERGGRERFIALLADQRLERARTLYGDLLAQVIAEVEKELNAS